VGIEHPFGETMGKPGDQDRQRAVLRGALVAVEEMKTPGSIQHLPFEWSGDEPQLMPLVPPPIVSYLKWHPWQLPRLLSRNVPHKA
jgi:hypothetical protein